MQQADAVARDQPAQAVADDAQLRDCGPVRREPPELVLQLLRDALAADLDAVVGVIGAVALRDKDAEGGFGVLGAQAGGEVLQMRRYGL